MKNQEVPLIKSTHHKDNFMTTKTNDQLIQELYDSEINFAICAPCWDLGFIVKIGTDLYDAGDYEHTFAPVMTYTEAVELLVQKAKELFPTSVFTKNNAIQGDDIITATNIAKENEEGAVSSLKYGRCPKCGRAGSTRERRLNGNDMCAAGCLYPSSQSIQ